MFDINVGITLPKILIVDDRQENLLALCAMLEGVDAEIVEASSGQSALEALLEYEFALVLLDVQMPEMDGYEVADFMKSSSSTSNIPIIFLTAISKEEHFVEKGYLHGAVDYIAKPLNTDILLSKVKIFLELWIQSNKLKILSNKYQDALNEITKQRDELNNLAFRDHLTGLYQRRAFDEFLLKEIHRAIRESRPLSIAMLDLDHFKAVNDNYGHALGDEVLVKTARCLEEFVRTSDVVCRIGGEEFVVLMPETSLEEAIRVSERVRVAVESTSVPSNSSLSITVSIGISELDRENNQTPDELLRQADEYLYTAKNNGRNRVFPAPVITP